MNEVILPDINALTGNWIGEMRGSAIGNLFAETTNIGGKLAVQLTTNENGQVGKFSGYLVVGSPKHQLVLDAVDSPEATKFPKPHIVAEIDSVSSSDFAGKWKSATGNSGVFWLRRATTAPLQNANSSPPELIAKEVILPRITIYREELESLIAKIRKLIQSPNDVVVTATIDGKDVSQFSSAFLVRNDLPAKVEHVRLSVGDNRQPLQSSINIVLSNTVPSQIFIQFDNSIWLSGALSELESFFRRFSNPIITIFQRHGLNLNFIFLLVVVAFLPDLTLTNRIVFLILALILASVFYWIHNLATSTRVYLGKNISRNRLAAETPRIFSGLVTATMAALLGLIGSVLYRFLQNDSAIILFFRALFGG